MMNERRNELLSHFGPLAKSLTDAIVCSLQDQLHSIEESSSSEILESVRAEMAGAMRFGVNNGQLGKRTSVAKFVNLPAIDVKTSSPKGNCRLELTTTNGPYVALVEVKQADDVLHYLRLVTTQPTDFIPVTAVKALVVVAAIPLTIDAIYDVLEELAPLLRREEEAGAANEAHHDDGAESREEAEARRQQRRVEREERKRVRRRAREAALRREIMWNRLTTIFKKLRAPVTFASLPVLLAVVAFVFRAHIPDWQGRKAYDIEQLASANGVKTELRPAVCNREYYQVVFNETRVTFHYVAAWLEFVGLKNKRRRRYFKALRIAANSPVHLLQWDFERLTYPSDRHLTFEGDPRDVDKVTQLMLDAITKLIGIWGYTAGADKNTWDEIREKHGLSLVIADDSDGSYSFWKRWSMMLVRELTPVYRFFEQNDFLWPTGGVTIRFIDHTTKDEVPYVRFK